MNQSVIATAESTSSTSYTDLATQGPALSVTLSHAGNVILVLSATMSEPALVEAVGYMSVELTDSTILGPSADIGLSMMLNGTTGGFVRSSSVVVLPLLAGTTIITAKYMTSGQTILFGQRSLMILG